MPLTADNAAWSRPNAVLPPAPRAVFTIAPLCCNARDFAKGIADRHLQNVPNARRPPDAVHPDAALELASEGDVNPFEVTQPVRD